MHIKEDIKHFIYGYNHARSTGKGIKQSLYFAWHHTALNINSRQEARHIFNLEKSGIKRRL
jgi:hypothetical protein